MEHDAKSSRENLWRFPRWHIEIVMSLDGHRLRSDREIRDTFQAYFCDHFTRLPDCQEEEFSSYLADFPRLQAAEAAICEGNVTECEVRDVLKQVSLKKSPGLDGLPYEMYLGLSHLFWRMCSNIGLSWELSSDMLPRATSHYWRKATDMVGKV